MDFPSIWKTASIALTGAFGILGLLTDFKDKETHKITRWGYLSLVGICVSTGLGMTAQVLEIASDAKKAAENSGRAVALAERIDENLQKTDRTLHGVEQISVQAVTLGQKTDKTLSDVERLLTPFEEPTITTAFAIPCKERRFKAFCNYSTQLPPFTILGTEVQTNLFSIWPKVDQHKPATPVTVNAYLSLYKNLHGQEDLGSDLYATSSGEDPEQDHPEPAKLILNRVPGLGETLWIQNYKLKPNINRTIRSMQDLKAAFLIIAEFAGGETLPPVYVMIHSKNGVVAGGLQCEEIRKSSLVIPPVDEWPDDDPSRIFKCALFLDNSQRP